MEWSIFYHHSNSLLGIGWVLIPFKVQGTLRNMRKCMINTKGVIFNSVTLEAIIGRMILSFLILCTADGPILKKENLRRTEGCSWHEEMFLKKIQWPLGLQKICNWIWFVCSWINSAQWLDRKKYHCTWEITVCSGSNHCFTTNYRRVSWQWLTFSVSVSLSVTQG